MFLVDMHSVVAYVPIQRSLLLDACHKLNAPGAQEKDCCCVVTDSMPWQEQHVPRSPCGLPFRDAAVAHAPCVTGGN